MRLHEQNYPWSPERGTGDQGCNTMDSIGDVSTEHIRPYPHTANDRYILVLSLVQLSII